MSNVKMQQIKIDNEELAHVEGYMRGLEAMSNQDNFSGQKSSAFLQLARFNLPDDG